MQNIDRKVIRRARRLDRLARWAITLGGVAIIASVIGILLLIAGVALPLLAPTTAEMAAGIPLPESIAGRPVLAVGIDRVEFGQASREDALTAHVLSDDGTFTFIDASDQPENAPSNPQPTVLAALKAAPPGQDDGRTIVAIERSAGPRYTLLWSDGAMSLVEPSLTPEFDELGRRSAIPRVRTLATLPAEGETRPVRALVRRGEDGTTVGIALLPDNRISVVRQRVIESILGDSETQTVRTLLDEGIPAAVTAMTADADATRLVVGTENGCLVTYKFNDENEVVANETIPAFRDQRGITALAMVFGDVAIAVGDAQGGLSAWFEVGEGTQRRLRLIHPLASHAGPVLDVVPSGRDKLLLSLGAGGKAALDYTTSESHLLSLGDETPLTAIGFAPRRNAAIGLDANHRLRIWTIDSPHPEVSLGTLLGKVHYENHDEPQFLWQSSGTDEPKFSLVPVIFGTLKATFYAMLFAVPLALFSAIYVSHFTTPSFRRTIKPIVETMAAVPTVVVGFLVLLWLAPLMGQWIVGLFASLVTLPVSFALFMVFWQWVRRYDWARRLENGLEFLVLAPILFIGAAVAVWLAGPLENALFGGSFPQWLFDTTGTPYDALNSITVAFGLGFAVIPIIFSISEDALSSVPPDLSAASLALGASRWQTAWRVVLPSASPGIFAAVMIGFGRAVGETMIVLMATGNTPIMDPGPFNGFRTLAANIAVEISEAPRDGTLYRVLFLCAVLLFLLTFLLNTAAELVRHRLRKRFGRY